MIAYSATDIGWAALVAVVLVGLAFAVVVFWRRVVHRPEEAQAPDTAWPYSPAPARAPAARRGRDPLARVFPGMPHSARVVLDWVLTIAGAVLIVLALKQWIVNPYRIPSSSMEPTLHCARPESGCLASRSDRVLACRFCYHFRSPHRGDIVVFNTPPTAKEHCGEGGVFVKRLIGLPGDRVNYDGRLRVNGKLIPEPYVQTAGGTGDTGLWIVPKGEYFMMGDNRSQSCD